MSGLNLQFTPAQLEIFSHPARFKTVVKGRRFGLTFGFSQYAIQQMFNENGLNVLWGDTVASNIKRYIARYWVPIMRKLPRGSYHWDKTHNIVHVKDSVCDFRSADRPENWEGYGYDLVLLNEAGIILEKEYLWGNAVRPMLLDNVDSRAIIGGAPKGRNQFYTLCCQKDKNWKHFAYTTFDNPFISKKEVDSLIDERMRAGGESAVKQEIYGEFLDADEFQFFPGEIIDRAFDRKYINGEEQGAPKIAGIDFSLKHDRCAIAHRQGVKLKDMRVFHPSGEQWTLRFAREVVNGTINGWAADHLFIDEGHAGGGLVDILYSWGYGDLITPVAFGSMPNKKEMYANKRFEMYADLKEWLDDRGSLPPHHRYANDIRKDLEMLTYGYTEKHKLKLKAKLDMARSPDLADALCLTFAEPVVLDHQAQHRDPYEHTNTAYVR